MTLYDQLFIIQFVVAVVAGLLLFYDVLHKGEKVGLVKSFVVFAVFLLCWFVGFSLAMIQFEDVGFLFVFKYEVVLLGLAVMFMFAEVMFHVRRVVVGPVARWE